MNVVHVCETLPGGPATYLQEVLSHQLSSEYIDEVTVIAPRIHEDMVPYREKVSVRLFGGGRYRFLRTLFLVWTLAIKLYHGNGGIVHLHSTFAGFGGRLLFPFFSHKYNFIYCSHGWAFDRAGPRFLGWVIKYFERYFAKFCHKIVCISVHDYCSGISAGISGGKLILVRNGVSESLDCQSLSREYCDESYLQDISKELLFVGRFDEQKGLDILIEAMKRLPSFRLRVIGSSVVDSPFDAVGMNNVEFLGWRDRTFVRAQMRKSGMLIVPSRWEGFGLVAAEALSEGRPVVASAVGGLRDIVEDGVTGYLFHSGSVDELVSAIVKCAEKVSLEGGFPLIQKVFKEKFSSERMNRELMDVYLGV